MRGNRGGCALAFLLGFNINGGFCYAVLVRNLASLGRGGRVLTLGAVLHAFFEAFDGTTQILANVFQLFGAKNQHNDQ